MGWINSAWTTATGDLKAFEPEALIFVNVVILASVTGYLVHVAMHSDVERPGTRAKYIKSIVFAVIALVFVNVIISVLFGKL